MFEPLQLIEIRRTQRRVAALLQYHDADIHVPKPSKRKKYQLFQNTDVCSRLDPEGKYQRSAHSYMRRGIQEAREYYQSLQSLDETKTQTGTDPPYNSPEVTRLSFKQVGAENENPIHISIKRKSGQQTSHEPSSGRRKDGVELQSDSSEHGKRGGVGGTAVADMHQLPRRKKQGRARDKFWQSEHWHQNLPRKHGENGQTNARAETRTEEAKRSISLPPIKDQRLPHSSEDSHPHKHRSLERTSLPKLPGSVREDEAHLRYQHGVARRSVPNNDLQISRDNTSEAMVRITQYAERRESGPFCSCDHPVVQRTFSDARARTSSAVCAECHTANGHASWCTARLHHCELCGKKVHTAQTAKSVTSSKYTQKSKELHSSSEVNDISNQRTDRFDKDSVDSGTESSSMIRDTVRSRGRRSSQYMAESTDEGYSSVKEAKVKKKVMYSFDTGEVVPPGTTPTYIMKMRDLDNQLELGTFDYDIKVDINNVDTTLRMRKDSERSMHSNSGSDMSHKVDSKSQNVNFTLYPEGAKEAYVKALAASRIQKLHSDPWLLHKQLSRSYVFSYYQNVPVANVTCANCGQNHPPRALQHSLPPVKRGKEMKHIFGNINVDDYYPGMKKNPLPGITEKINRKPKKKDGQSYKKGKKEKLSGEGKSKESSAKGTEHSFSDINIERQLSSIKLEYKQKNADFSV